jgi:hypothetical protein
MVRSTDSRRARNSDSVTIGGRRRPVSLPSRRRCFFASSLVEPFTDRTSSLPFGSRTCTTVSGGSSGASESEPAVPSAEPRRRLRLRLRALAEPDSSSSPSAVPPSSDAPLAAASSAPADGSTASLAAPPRRLRVREAGLRPSGCPAPFPGPFPASSGEPWATSAAWFSGWSSTASAVASWSPFLDLPRLGLRRRRRPEAEPSSSSPRTPGPPEPAKLPAASASPCVPALVSDGPEGEDPDAGSACTGSGLAVGGWNTTGGGWNTAAGTLGFSSLASRPPAASPLESLSYSSLSSIRAISSQAPGRAVSQRSAR